MAMNYTQDITLDLNANTAYTTVVAKQGDNEARTLTIHLTRDNIAYPIDASHHFMFRMRKPDGHGVINPAIVQLAKDFNYLPIVVTFNNYNMDTYYSYNNNTKIYDSINKDNFFTELNPKPEDYQGYYIKQDNGDYQLATSENTGENIALYSFEGGSYYYLAGTVNYENSTILVRLTRQALAVAGRGYADIVEYDNEDNILSSVSFILNVMASPNVASNATSTDEFQQLTELVSQSQQVVANVKELSPYINDDTKTWMVVDKENEQEVSWIDTGIKAEGEKGDSGVSYYIVKVEQGTPDSLPSVTRVDYGALIGTPYYADSNLSEGEELGTLGQVAEVKKSDGNNIVYINNIPRYIKDTDVKESGNLYIFYSLTIPQGIQGLRGPAGAGGVTWVDGIDGIAAYKFFDEFDELGARTFEATDFLTKYKINKLDSDNVEKIIGYKEIKLDDNDTIYNVTIEIDSINNNKFIITFNSNPEIDTSSSHLLLGHAYIDSANVSLYAVSYNKQTSIITYDSQTEQWGEKIITVDDKQIARENIDAMKNVPLIQGVNQIISNSINYTVPANTSYYTDSSCTELAGSVIQTTVVTVDSNIWSFTSDTIYYVTAGTVESNDIWSSCVFNPLTSNEIIDIVNNLNI